MAQTVNSSEHKIPNGSETEESEGSCRLGRLSTDKENRGETVT